MFIYKVTNLINDKVYIGLTTTTLKRRWKEHCKLTGGAKVLSNAIHKYGKDSFSLEILEECGDIEALNFAEIRWIREFNSLCPNGYNIESGGRGKGRASEETRRKISLGNTGKILSEETKRKIGVISSEKIKEKSNNWGKHFDDQWKRNMSLAHRGFRHTEEAKNKVRISKLGKPRSLDTREKISKTRLKRADKINYIKGKDHPNFGKSMPEETKDKLRRFFAGEGNPLFGKRISLEAQERKKKSQKITLMYKSQIKELIGWEI